MSDPEHDTDRADEPDESDDEPQPVVIKAKPAAIFPTGA